MDAVIDLTSSLFAPVATTRDDSITLTWQIERKPKLKACVLASYASINHKPSIASTAEAHGFQPKDVYSARSVVTRATKGERRRGDKITRHHTALSLEDEEKICEWYASCQNPPTTV
jgi:hypothetical protein